MDVFVRIRPLLANEEQINQEKEKIKQVDDQTLKLIDNKKTNIFKYTKVFNTEYTQEMIYNESSKRLVDNLFNGINSLLFAYGITNSGKSYTIKQGIIPNTMNDIFNRIKNNTQYNYQVYLSLLEIYNEKLYDLSTTNECTIRENVDGEILVENMQEYLINDQNEAMNILNKSYKHQHIDQTNSNHQSSRSHSILLLN